MRSLLAATDLSSRSDRALRRAGLLAGASGAGLTILHVVDDDQPEAMVEAEIRDAERVLADEASALGAACGVAPVVTIRSGHPADRIAREAEAGGHDLVVMGAHRRRVLADVFVGTTVERVVRTGRQPVLMANGPASTAYRSVAVGLDFSPDSDRALAAAAGLGLLAAPRLTLIHAAPLDATGLMAFAGASADAVQDHLSRARAEAAAALRARRDGLDLPATTTASVEIRAGDPARVVADCAAQAGADLLVIGTRGAGGLSRLLLGSVAETLLRTMQIDVLAVAARTGGETGG